MFCRSNIIRNILFQIPKTNLKMICVLPIDIFKTLILSINEFYNNVKFQNRKSFKNISVLKTFLTLLLQV